MHLFPGQCHGRRAGRGVLAQTSHAARTSDCAASIAWRSGGVHVHVEGGAALAGHAGGPHARCGCCTTIHIPCAHGHACACALCNGPCPAAAAPTRLVPRHAAAVLHASNAPCTPPTHHTPHTHTCAYVHAPRMHTHVHACAHTCAHDPPPPPPPPPQLLSELFNTVDALSDHMGVYKVVSTAWPHHLPCVACNPSPPPPHPSIQATQSPLRPLCPSGGWGMQALLVRFLPPTHPLTPPTFLLPTPIPVHRHCRRRQGTAG